jgi:hypothetical protein
VAVERLAGPVPMGVVYQIHIGETVQTMQITETHEVGKDGLPSVLKRCFDGDVEIYSARYISEAAMNLECNVKAFDGYCRRLVLNPAMQNLKIDRRIAI